MRSTNDCGDIALAWAARSSSFAVFVGAGQVKTFSPPRRSRSWRAIASPTIVVKGMADVRNVRYVINRCRQIKRPLAVADMGRKGMAANPRRQPSPENCGRSRSACWPVFVEPVFAQLVKQGQCDSSNIRAAAARLPAVLCRARAISSRSSRAVAALIDKSPVGASSRGLDRRGLDRSPQAVAAPTSYGKSVTSSCVRSHSTTARSIRFSSSRTLPGNGNRKRTFVLHRKDSPPDVPAAGPLCAESAGRAAKCRQFARAAAARPARRRLSDSTNRRESVPASTSRDRLRSVAAITRTSTEISSPCAERQNLCSCSARKASPAASAAARQFHRETAFPVGALKHTLLITNGVGERALT